jgi:hypothetical protein
LHNLSVIKGEERKLRYYNFNKTIKQEEAPLLSFLFISSSMWAMAIHARTRTRAKCKLVEIERRELINQGVE